jgi:hypothetical protein
VSGGFQGMFDKEVAIAAMGIGINYWEILRAHNLEWESTQMKTILDFAYKYIPESLYNAEVLQR